MIESDNNFVASGRRKKTALAPDEPSAGSENIVDLVRQLAGQGSHLAEQQLSLVKAEIRQATGEIKASIGAIAGAAVVGIAGLGVLLMGLAYLLGDAIDNLGLGTLIVGAATLAIAYLLYRAGANKMSNAHLTPERSQRTLERTPEIARGDLHTEHTR
jgi:hypothetical protein